MARSGASLKSIAQKAGVSTTTVHRALTGKKDCSQAMRERILQIAQEEGYEVNYRAAALNMRVRRIAYIAGWKDKDSRFFVDKIISGSLSYEEEMDYLPLTYEHILCSSLDDLTGALKEIATGHMKADALVGHLISIPDKALSYLGEILEADKIPVLLMESAPTGQGSAPVVGVDNAVAGHLAGEIIARMTFASGRVLILSQRMNSPDVNAADAAAELRLRRPDLEVEEVPLPLLNEDNSSVVRKLIDSRPVALYTTCARHTMRAIEAMGRVKKVSTFVGSELFDESVKALGSGLIDALIDKRPDEMGRQAMSLMAEHLVRGVPLDGGRLVQPVLVLRSNAAARAREAGVSLSKETLRLLAR